MTFLFTGSEDHCDAVCQAIDFMMSQSELRENLNVCKSELNNVLDDIKVCRIYQLPAVCIIVDMSQIQWLAEGHHGRFQILLPKAEPEIPKMTIRSAINWQC